MRLGYRQCDAGQLKHLFLLAPLLLISSATAAEIQVYYPALQRILAEQRFTPEGRLYLRGAPGVKCTFAYIENAAIGSDNGRLKLSGRFSGRSALDVFGRCVGLGDSFDLAIIATPYPVGSVLAFKDVQVDVGPRPNYYKRAVRNALLESFSAQMRIDVGAELKKAVEAPGQRNYQPQLNGFTLSYIRVLPDSLVLGAEFRLGVR